MDYTPGYGAHLRSLNKRSAHTHAGFLLPKLDPSMHVLDCGCGTGSISVGLAQTVYSGLVVGIDISPVQIGHARAASIQNEIQNLKFMVGDVYELPFNDGTFDAVFAHTLLLNLANPEKAVQEAFRVLKIGGFIAVREEDQGTAVYSPSSPLLDQARELYLTIWQKNGGHPYLARTYKSLLRLAGFSNIEISASASVKASQDLTIQKGDMMADMILERKFVNDAIRLELADVDLLKSMSRAWKEWGRHSDAVFADINFEAIGWKN